MYRSHPSCRHVLPKVVVALPVLILVSVLPTWAASLSDGDVTPNRGTPETTFIYSVTYTGDVRPLDGYVVIDQMTRRKMRPDTGVETDPSAGIVYKAAAHLKREGVHRYRFVFLIPGEDESAVAGDGGPADREGARRIFFPGPTGAETLRGPVVTIPDVFTIAGTVKAGPDQPVAGVIIKAKKDGEPAATATTNREGKYRIGDLEKGVYVVTARDPSGQYALLPVERKVRVPPSRRNVDFAAVPPTLIAGKVRDLRGQPLAGATVLAHKIVDDVEAAPAQTTTNRRGCYRFGDLEAGVYAVRVKMEGYKFRPRVRRVKVGPPKIGVNFIGTPLPKATLTDGDVSPDRGTTSTLFTYSVVYTHPDGIPPYRVWVAIDDHRLVAMTPDPADADVTDGVVYTYETDDLTSGEHEFRFQAAYKEGPTTYWLLCPGPRLKDKLPGPTVISE